MTIWGIYILKGVRGISLLHIPTGTQNEVGRMGEKQGEDTEVQCVVCKNALIWEGRLG